MRLSIIFCLLFAVMDEEMSAFWCVVVPPAYDVGIPHLQQMTMALMGAVIMAVKLMLIETGAHRFTGSQGSVLSK